MIRPPLIRLSATVLAVRQAVLWLASLFVIATVMLTEANPMTENQKYLEEAQAGAREFEEKLEPELLKQAYLALENVILQEEYDPKIRAQLRTNSLALWLRLIQLLDRCLDPDFDPADVPERLVQPPPTPEGVVYRPGAKPALIDDPKVRAAYEKAIAANEAKTAHFVFQTKLRRLDERIFPRAEAFIQNAYGSGSDDQEELKSAIDAFIKDAERKERLSKLLTVSSD